MDRNKTAIRNSRFSLLLVILAILPFLSEAASPNAPYNLRSYDKFNPVGADDKPYFGWYVNDPDKNEIQSAFQILVATSPSKLASDNGDIWNSGKVGSRKQNYVYAEGKPLMAATRYYWKVRTWDKDGNVSPYSASATFETGLLANSDWVGAKWIKRNSAVEDDYTYFRKRTILPNKTIIRATVYITACHSYELFVNGKLIGKGSNNHYPQYSYYNAWDISSALISNSENVLACLTHWYGGGQGRATGARGLLVKTIIEYSDSTTSTICSDNTWKQIQAEQWVTGQPERNGEGVGRVEKIDSRKIIQDWNTLNYDDSSWHFASEIGAHPVAPWTGTLRSDLTRVIEEEIKPVSITNHGGGKYVIDLGKIYSGSFKIAFSGGNSGDTIKLHGGFVLNADGTVSTKFDQGTNLDFYFILNGRTAVFNPNVYLGIRYLEVSNAPNVLNTGNVRFVFRHFELDPSRSEFYSSSPMLNSVWNLMRHSLLVGAQESFVDTPTREKGGFLSDGWSQAVPALSVMGDRVMNLRVLSEFLDSQDQYWPDGRLNAVYPNVDGARDIPDFTQSYLVWVWDYYMQTGNIEFLRANFSKLKKVANYVSSYKNDTTGLIHKLAGGGGPYQYGIVDWPPSMRYGYDMSVESRTVIDAYAYIDFDIVSRIAGVLGNLTERDIYKTRANDIKTAINARLINKDGVYIDGLNHDKSASSHISQHSNIYPLAMGIVPESNMKQVITEIKNRKMNVGMVSLRWLPEALGVADQGPHLIDLYTNTEWDGWAKTVAHGGTVTWETWIADKDNDSMSHPWGAVGLLGMQQYMLGIKPLAPQHESIQVKPLDFDKKLASVRGLYPTDKGDIVINWSRDDKHFLMTLTIPDNITAKVYVPKCGLDGSLIKVNGVDTKGVEEGNYIFIENVGSGVSIFERGRVL
ncbi:MAG: family 78 glycoside hydrolase catalytic domain [Prolixibacteraceae bacterium]|jgi:alpha-L-rhamnosidase|nr:family 78 glycoside hydrolase catalytic domain [Prolixibacteraceae bacterium]